MSGERGRERDRKGEIDGDDRGRNAFEGRNENARTYDVESTVIMREREK